MQTESEKMDKESEKVTYHVLVTGGAGCIGSSLVPMLLKDGFEVTVYDIFHRGISSLLSVIPNPKLHIVKGDIRDKNDLNNAMLNKDIIVHLAAIVGYPACEKDPITVQDTNILGTKNIVDLLKPEQKLVYASTGSCYVVADDACTEDSRICSLTIYGRTKGESDRYVLEAGGVSLRLATIFGLSPGFRHDLLINDLAHKAVSFKKIEIIDGSYCRSFLHVQDAAKAFVFALNHYEQMQGKAYNVGDEQMTMSKINIARFIQDQIEGCIISEISGSPPIEKRHHAVSYDRIKQLGYRSTISIEQGIKDMLKCLPLLHPMV